MLHTQRFRSDPLEEIVGLDTSYHGGLILGADEGVNPEYITEFRKQRNELRRRHYAHALSVVSVDNIEETDVEEQS